MAYTTLISPAALHEHFREPTWRIFDCRSSASDPAVGARRYAAGHIPEARHADLDRVLAAPPGPDTGRHPLPDRDMLAAWLGQEGVGDDSQVIAYDDAGGAFAARLWWLLRWLGHSAAAVLDGGIQAWQVAGGRLERGSAGALAPRDFRPHPPLAEVATTADVAPIASGARAERLLDARDRRRYLGEEEPIDPVAGHIPHARNRPFRENLDDTGRFREPARLRREFATLTDDPHATVHYCGSGVTACHNLLAMEYAGLPGSRLYPGSWSEWIRDPERPVRRGPEPD